MTGGQSESGGTWTVTGGGTDIYGTADQFHFISQPLAADGKMSAQVVTQSNTSVWAKAGIMLRQNNSAGSPFYFAAVTPSNGIHIYYRATQDGSTSDAVPITGTVPAYLLISRVGTTFATYTSTDGVNWTLLAGSSVTVSMTGAVLAGLAVTAHSASALSTVTFNAVTVSASSTIYACPTAWNCADIGSPALKGTESLNNGTWTVIGGGSDIYGTADQFHYVWQPLTGTTGSVTAHVTAQTNTSSWAKSGVMIRQDSTAGSAYYAAYVTPSNGIAIQYRTAAGASANGLLTIAGTVPTYLAVAISGTTFTAYTSADGVTWTLVAGSTFTISMTGPVLAGLAVCSHNVSQLDTATFDTVTVGSTIP
jgi:hypothetical protein